MSDSVFEVVEIELHDPVEAETAKAIMFTIDGEEFWIPKKCIAENSEVTGRGDTGTLIVSRSIAAEKGLV